MSIFDLTQAKWELVKILSKKEMTPTELAKKLGTSIPNISQQLTILEAKGFLTKKKNLRKEKRVTYKLNKEKTGIIMLSQNPKRKEITIDEETKYLLNIIINEIKHKKELINFYFQNQELIKKAEILAVFDETQNEIHILIITKNLKYFREQSNIEITGKKLIFWSHTKEEVTQGLKNKEDYFEQKIKNSKYLIKNMDL